MSDNKQKAITLRMAAFAVTTCIADKALSSVISAIGSTNVHIMILGVCVLLLALFFLDELGFLRKQNPNGKPRKRGTKRRRPPKKKKK